MKKFLQLLSLMLTVILGGAFNLVYGQTTYYWVGGSGNWNDGSHWSLNTGGEPVNLVPGASDDARFDIGSFDPTSAEAANPYTVTINANVACRNIDWTGAQANPILAGTSMLTVNGAFILIPNMNITFSGAIVFASATPTQIDAAGKEFQGSMEFNGNGSWDMLSGLGVVKDLTIKKGTLKANNNTITSSGNWIITDPGKFESGTGTVILKGNEDREINITAGNTFYNLEINKNNNSSVLLKSEIQVKQDLIISSGSLKDEGFQINKGFVSNGTLTIANGASLALGDDIANNNATSFPSFNSRNLGDNSTVNYRDRATPQTVLGISYGNLILSNGPTAAASPLNLKNLSAAATVRGDLIVGNNINFQDNGFQITGNNNAGKKLQLLGSGTLTLGSASTTTTMPNFPVYDLSATSTVVYNAGQNQTIKGLTGTGNSSYGNLVLNNPTATSKTKTIDNFDATNPVNIRGNLTIGANNTLDVSTSNDNNNIRNINIQGDWISRRDGNNLGTFYGRSGTVTFNGTKTQTITANSDITAAPNNASNVPVSANNFFNIVINNAAGITINSPVTIGRNTGDKINPTDNGKVDFINGIITTNGVASDNSANILIFNNNAQATGAKNNSHVNGYVNKVGDDNFMYPIGNGTIYRPAGVTNFNNRSQTVAYTARYFQRSNPENDSFIRYTEVNPVNNPTTLLPLNGPVVKYEYWQIKLTSTNAGGRIMLTWESPYTDNGDGKYLPNPPTGLVVAGWENNKWNNRGGTNILVSNTTAYAGNVTSTEATSNSLEYWTIGTIFNALPIELLYFRAQVVGEAVQLNWATASEKDNDYFTIEKSRDATDFKELTRISGAGNSQVLKKYTFTDHNPYDGITYYRLKQTDTNGKFVYSKVASVQNNGIGIFLEAKLTGEKQLELHYQISDTDLAQLTIYDSRGVTVWAKSVTANAATGKQVVELSSVSNGLYIVTLQTAGSKLIKKIVLH